LGGLAVFLLEPLALEAAVAAGLAATAGVRIAGVALDLHLPVPGPARHGGAAADRPTWVIVVVTPHRQQLRAPGAPQQRAVLCFAAAREEGACSLPSGPIEEGEDAETAAVRVAGRHTWSSRSALPLKRLGIVPFAPQASESSTLAAVLQVEAPRSLSREWATGAPPDTHWRFVPLDDDPPLAAPFAAVRPLLDGLDWTYWHRGGPPRAIQARRQKTR
jgi:hypothetical protein